MAVVRYYVLLLAPTLGGQAQCIHPHLAYISRSALCAVGRKTLFIEVPCNQVAVDSTTYVCVCSRQDQLNDSTQIGSGSPSHTRDRKRLGHNIRVV